MTPVEAPLSVDDFRERTDASDHACEALLRYAALLEKWQKRFNLVGPSTVNDIWRRHFLDSAQLIPLICNRDAIIADLGSGAGFPGLILSILGQSQVNLIESDSNKAEFLRQAIRETGADAVVHRKRIEDYDGPPASIVTSRACAPLGRLLGYADQVRQLGAEALFLKGRRWEDELTKSQSLWHIEYRSHPSWTDPEGIALQINDYKRR